MKLFIIACWIFLLAPGAWAAKPELDRSLEQARQHAEPANGSPGSLFLGGQFADLARDLRSYQLDDVVMIVVSDKAAAVAKGATTSSRQSDASASVTGLFGTPPAAARLANLAGLKSDSSLQGQGETSRETTLTTTISARVVEVLPNGYLVVEGFKQIAVNSEQQRVVVRGIIRPADVNNANQISSDRLANLEIRIDGKGVVQDSIRRPNILYRILLGILPF